MVSVSVRYLFYQPMDEEIKTWPLCFPAKENLNMEKALFDWLIVLQYDVNQPKATRVCICSINQSNRSISLRLLCMFCSRVFTSRTYENRFIKKIPLGSSCHNFFGDFCMHSFNTWKVSIHLQPNHFTTYSAGAIKSVHIKGVEFRKNVRAFVPQVQEKLSAITRWPY